MDDFDKLFKWLFGLVAAVVVATMIASLIATFVGIASIPQLVETVAVALGGGR